MKIRSRWIQILGVLLILVSIGSVLFLNVHEKRMDTKNREVVAQMQELLPARKAGSPLDYSQPEMPVLQIAGKDYVCLLEVPGLGVTLPVGNTWQSGLLPVPVSRFWGSIYDGTLILGGSNREGQFDFCSRLDLGDRLVIVDMQGTEFQCSVARIDRSSSVDFGVLHDPAYPLTLFVREEYDARYILVRCEWPS